MLQFGFTITSIRQEIHDPAHQSLNYDPWQGIDSRLGRYKHYFG